jgi:threonine/homoserine/homoserine lactone efflux protein
MDRAGHFVYLELNAIWSKQGPLSIGTDVANGRNSPSILRQAFLSNVLNPEVALLFLALFPQFFDRNALHPTLQIVLLSSLA